MKEDQLLLAYEPYTDNELGDDYEYFKEELEEILTINNVHYPCTLAALKSNWRGQDGYVHVENFQDLVNKIFSFDNEDMALWRDDEGLYFKTASHDVPMGFIIRIVNEE